MLINIIVCLFLLHFNSYIPLYRREILKTCKAKKNEPEKMPTYQESKIKAVYDKPSIKIKTMSVKETCF